MKLCRIRRFLKTAILILAIAAPVFAQSTSDVDFLPDFKEESRALLNDQLRRTNRRLIQVEDAYVSTTIFNAKYDTSTGHDHDGADSKKVLATNLDMTGITTGHYLYNNDGTLAGKTLPPFALELVETKTLSGDTTTTFSGLSTGTTYLVIGNLLYAGTGGDQPLSATINGTVTYTNASSFGNYKIADGCNVNDEVFFEFKFSSMQGDTSHVIFFQARGGKLDVGVPSVIDGLGSEPTFADSDAALSTLTITSGIDNKTFTGKISLYKIGS